MAKAKRIKENSATGHVEMGKLLIDKWLSQSFGRENIAESTGGDATAKKGTLLCEQRSRFCLARTLN